MRLAALFRFHAHYDVCAQNLGYFRRLNPAIPVYGMYGGVDELESLPPLLLSMMDECWKIPLEDPFYKWKNGDACARWWFKERGHEFPFDHLLLIDWDTLLNRPVAEAFPLFEKSVNYGTVFFRDYADARENWVWVRDYDLELECLFDYLDQTMSSRIDMENLPFFPIMVWACFAREYLEKISAIHLPTTSNDELRFSVLSAAFGIELRDNLLWEKTHFVHTEGYEAIQPEHILEEVRKGTTFIHPVRILLPNSLLTKLPT